MLVVPIRTGRGPNLREHHMARHRRVKAEREAVGWVLPKTRPRPPLPCEVVLTRISPPGGRKLDDDNLRGSLKAIRDAVAEWLGVDDGSEQVHWSYRQERGEWGVRIEFADPLANYV